MWGRGPGESVALVLSTAFHAAGSIRDSSISIGVAAPVACSAAAAAAVVTVVQVVLRGGAAAAAAAPPVSPPALLVSSSFSPARVDGGRRFFARSMPSSMRSYRLMAVHLFHAELEPPARRSTLPAVLFHPVRAVRLPPAPPCPPCRPLVAAERGGAIEVRGAPDARRGLLAPSPPSPATAPWFCPAAPPRHRRRFPSVGSLGSRHDLFRAVDGALAHVSVKELQSEMLARTSTGEGAALAFAFAFAFAVLPMLGSTPEGDGGGGCERTVRGGGVREKKKTFFSRRTPRLRREISCITLSNYRFFPPPPVSVSLTALVSLTAPFLFERLSHNENLPAFCGVHHHRRDETAKRGL